MRAWGWPTERRVTMPTSKQDIEPELSLSEKDKAIDALRRTVEDINELEAQITAEEERAGLVRSGPNAPLVDRLARLGYRKATRDRITWLFDAIEDLRHGRVVSLQIKSLLTDREVAEQSADDLLAAVVERGNS
jgi:hypothetical protein